MITILSDIQEFLSYRDSWMELCQNRTRPYTPYQHFDFIYFSWEHICSNMGDLHIIVLTRQNDQMVQAIFPCYIDKKKCLRFINDRHSDFCSAIIRDEFVDDYHLYAEFYEYYQTNKAIRRIQLINICESNPLFANLAYFLKGSINRVVNVCSDFYIPQADDSQVSFVNGLSRLNTKEKYRLKNVLNKTADLSLRVFESGSATFPDTVIVGLIQQMIHSGIRKAGFFDTHMMSLFRSLYDAGLLSVFVTSENEQPVAANLILKDGNEYIDWIALYSEKSNNLKNLLQVVEYVSNTGGGCLNFARGAYEYKIHNFRPALHFLFGIYHSKSFWGKIADLWHADGYSLRQIAKCYLRK